MEISWFNSMVNTAYRNQPTYLKYVIYFNAMLRMNINQTKDTIKNFLLSILKHGVEKENLSYMLNPSLMGFIYIISERYATGQKLHPGPISKDFQRELKHKSEKMKISWEKIGKNNKIMYSNERLLSRLKNPSKGLNPDLGEPDESTNIDIFDVNLPKKRKKQ